MGPRSKRESAFATRLTPRARARRLAEPMPHRERYLFICTNRRKDDDPRGSCAHKGAEEVLVALKTLLKQRGLADRVRACGATCLDMCETGISIVQEPDHVAYGNVRASDVEDIVDAIAKGEIVDHLVVARPES